MFSYSSMINASEISMVYYRQRRESYAKILERMKARWMHRPQSVYYKVIGQVEDEIQDKIEPTWFISEIERIVFLIEARQRVDANISKSVLRSLHA